MITAAILTVILPIPVVHAQPSADEIASKSLEIYGGDDSVSRLTFSFREPNTAERKLIYTMLWKKYKGKGDLMTKMIFFQEFPPAGKDIAYMTWLYRPDAKKEDEEWLYLPELRTVRKLSRKMDGHSHGGHQHDENDEFAKSVLHQPHLVPRPAHLDTHKLLEPVEIDGTRYHVIERTPKKTSDHYPYSKIINRISQDNFLLSKLDYFDADGNAVMTQTIHWQKAGDAWVWDTVEGTDLKTGNVTVLKVSDVQVNIGIDDDTFTKRVMKLGVGSLRLPAQPITQ